MNEEQSAASGPWLIRGRPAPASALCVAIFAVLCACGVGFGQQKPPKTSQAKSSPARAKDAKHADHKGHAKSTTVGVASLDVYVDGSRVHLLVAERPPGGKPHLSYLGSTDGGATWSTPAPVGRGEPTPDPVKRGADAQIAAAGDRLVAVWTTGADTRFGRGPLATAISSDGGRTWQAGPNPADDGLMTDHAYVDLAADDRGAFHAVWLDGRGGEAAGKGLRYARSTDGGRSWSANATLDERCCECCWNVIQTLPGGRVNVLNRNRDPRDMSLLASRDGGKSWDVPVAVGAFEWAFDGCPHVGGALAMGDADGKDRAAPMVAVVWTAKGGSELGVFALASADAGKSWEVPVQLGGPNSNRPDVAFANGRAVAVWDAFDHSGTATYAAESTDGGVTWSPPQRLSEAGAVATHARVVPTAGGFRVFWTEQRPGKPVAWASRTVD